MKKKIIILLTATLLGSALTLTTSQPVQAISKKAAVSLSQHNQSYRKVKLTKTTYVRKIHWRIPNYKSTVGPKIKLKKNKVVRIQQTGADFGWYMHIPGRSGDYTIVKRYNDYSWFKLM